MRNLFFPLAFPLALAQTIIWASTFYLFPSLLLVWEQETFWTKSELSIAYTLSLLSLSFTSIFAGRLIDRGLGSSTMLIANLSAALGLFGLSLSVELWQFYLCWIWIGCAMGAGLYDMCFSLLVRHYGLEARGLITRITLIAGFAGTLSFPILNFFAYHYGWRVSVFIAALSVLLLVFPLNIFGLRTLSKVPIPSPSPEESHKSIPISRRLYLFSLLSLSFTLITFCATMLMTHLVPLLVERGNTLTFSLLLASLVGPMQVFGRLVFFSFESRLTTYFTSLLCFLSLSLAFLLLLFSGISAILLLCFVVLYGSFWGILSILRPVLIRLTLGAEGYGFNSGRISSFSYLGSAFAPFAGAYLWGIGGYDLLLLCAFTFCLLGFLSLLLLRRH